jgi:hypothetical protein
MPPSNSYRVAYLKPPWFTAKVFNRVAMATGVSNSEPNRLPAEGGRSVDGYFRKLPDPADHPVFALTAATP